MASTVDGKKANERSSVSIACCYCFLLKETVFHKKVSLLACFCFRCCLKNLLRDVLVEREEQRILFVVTVNNFDQFSDNEVCTKLLSICIF